VDYRPGRSPRRARADEELPVDENIVSLGRETPCPPLGQRESGRGDPALDLIFSTAIGNFDLTAFVQALQRVELAISRRSRRSRRSTIARRISCVGEPRSHPRDRRERRQRGRVRGWDERAALLRRLQFQQTVSTSPRHGALTANLARS